MEFAFGFEIEGESTTIVGYYSPVNGINGNMTHNNQPYTPPDPPTPPEGGGNGGNEGNSNGGDEGNNTPTS